MSPLPLFSGKNGNSRCSASTARPLCDLALIYLTGNVMAVFTQSSHKLSKLFRNHVICFNNSHILDFSYGRNPEDKPLQMSQCHALEWHFSKPNGIITPVPEQVINSTFIIIFIREFVYFGVQTSALLINRYESEKRPMSPFRVDPNASVPHNGLIPGMFRIIGFIFGGS